MRHKKLNPECLKGILRIGILTGLPGLLLSGCFMQSAVPLSPVAQASYPADIIDTWVMLHNKNTIHVVEKMDDNRLKITFKGRGKNRKGDQISYAHISHLDGETFLNNKSAGKDRYDIYKFDRPCPDLILIYLPNPDLIDKDIKSGRIKGRIEQDFFTDRIIEENRSNLIKYIKGYQGKLFVPFRYMVRLSQRDTLSEECKLKIKPLPGQR